MKSVFTLPLLPFKTFYYWRKSGDTTLPGKKFASYGFSLGFKLLLRGKISLRLLFNPVSIVRYFEFDFVHSFIGNTDDKNILDVSSPHLFGFFISDKNNCNYYYINPDKNDLENVRSLSSKIKFIGTVDNEIVKSISSAGLDPYTDFLGFLPYQKMLTEICKADFLLVCATEPRHVPGKLFKYLRAGKPILAFGDNNEEVRKILEESNAGMIFGYENRGEEFFRSSSSLKTKEGFVNGFERKVGLRPDNRRG